MPLPLTIGIGRTLMWRRRIAAPGLTYRIRDHFTTDIATLVDGPAEPGPGTRDVNGTSWKVFEAALRGGVQLSSPTWANGRLLYDGLTRTDGRTVAAYVILSDATDQLAVGWTTNTGETDPTTDGHHWINDNGLYLVATPGQLVTLASNPENIRPIEMLVVIAQKPAGALYFLSAVHADWAAEMQDPFGIPAYPSARLMWVTETDTTTPLYPAVYAARTVDTANPYPNGMYVDDVRVVDIASWANDGLATTVDRTVKTAGGLFATAGSATGIFHITMTFPTTSATAPAGIMIRRVDANNYFRFWTNNTNTISLQSIVGGAFNATHMSTAFTWTQGGVYHFVIEDRGDRFRIIGTGAGNLNTGWVSTTLHNTGTGFGSYEQSATDGTWTNLVHYPHTITLPTEIGSGRVPTAWVPGSDYATDTFTAANGTTLSGRTTTTGGQTWTVRTGTWTVQGNRASATTASGTTILTIPRPGDTYEVEADITFDNPYTAVLGGFALNYDPTTGYATFVRLLSGERDEIEINEFAPGSTFSGIAKKIDLTDTRFVAGGTYNLRVQVSPGGLRVFLDDVIRMSHALSQGFTGAHVGLYDAGNYTIDWDTFTVRALTVPTGAEIGPTPNPAPPPTDSFPTVNNLVWRFRAGAEAGNDGDLIATATDQSGNSHNATAAGTARPTLKKNILNGKAVYRFNGTSNALTISAFDLSATSTLTLYAVANTSDSGAQKILVENTADYNGSTTGFVVLKDTANVIAGNVKGNVDYSTFNTTGTLGTTSRLIRALFNKALSTNEVTVELNHSTAGTRALNGNNTNAFGNNTTYIGARGGTSSFWLGDIAEMVLIAGDPSSGEKTALDAYFLAEYGV